MANISVRDDRGFIDNFTLQNGTIINLRGLTLAPGQPVTISGCTAGLTFLANQIDTPYVALAAPRYGYQFYPAYGVGFDLGSDEDVSISEVKMGSQSMTFRSSDL